MLIVQDKTKVSIAETQVDALTRALRGDNHLKGTIFRVGTERGVRFLMKFTTKFVLCLNDRKLYKRIKGQHIFQCNTTDDHFTVSSVQVQTATLTMED